MTVAAHDLASGKGHRDENFPVASFIIKPQYRAPIMAFYRFARLADDIADNPETAAPEKLRLLADMRAGIEGRRSENGEAVALQRVMRELSLDPQHARDLLTAFKRDARGEGIATWEDLIDYCRYSAMPVGRYVLDVHGESPGCRPASDALCAALQIINHLQDCAKDYRALGRVYLPSDLLTQHGAAVADLAEPAATAALRAVIVEGAHRADALLVEAAPFSAMVRDTRLAIEISVIHRLAVDLVQRLKSRDPLSERVHHRPIEAAGLALSRAVGTWLARQKRGRL